MLDTTSYGKPDRWGGGGGGLRSREKSRANDHTMNLLYRPTPPSND